MGDVVRMWEARVPRRRRETTADDGARGAILLFTGIRIEHWADAGDPGRARAPKKPPRRRRRD